MCKTLTLFLALIISLVSVYSLTFAAVNKEKDNVIIYEKYIYGDKTNYEHNSILRASLSDPLGDPITVEDDMKAERLAFSTTIPSQCKVDNLRVVVYIQRLDPSRNSYYVDNAFSAPAGSARLLEVASDNVEDGDEE